MRFPCGRLRPNGMKIHFACQQLTGLALRELGVRSSNASRARLGSAELDLTKSWKMITFVSGGLVVAAPIARMVRVYVYLFYSKRSWSWLVLFFLWFSDGAARRPNSRSSIPAQLLAVCGAWCNGIHTRSCWYLLRFVFFWDLLVSPPPFPLCFGTQFS